MAEYVHPEREPADVLKSEFVFMQMGEWFWANGHILLGDE